MQDKNPEKTRILALDLGTKTIGLAVSDPGRQFVRSLGVIRRRNMKSDLAELARAIEENEAAELVLGLPLHLSGNESEGSARSRKFADILDKEFGLPVHLVDESLTTVEAEKAMIEGNVSRKKRKKLVDGLAATFILQSYLNELKEKEVRQ